MIQKLKQLTLLLALVMGIGFLTPVSVGAASVISEQCKGVTDSTICKNQNDSPTSFARTIINVLLFVAGAISVIMIIVGGLMYVASAGDSGQVTKAKNTVLYAVAGLVVSILAYAIVRFVTDQLIK